MIYGIRIQIFIILGHVPPVPTLSFVRKSRGKAGVGGQILSENLFERKLGRREMTSGSTDPAVFQEFRDALGTRDPKTIATYLTTMRDFVAWLAAQPGGAPFHLGLVTETAVRGYMDSLQSAGRAPRTRSKALSALRRFCRWAVDEGSEEHTSELQSHSDLVCRLLLEKKKK